MIAQLDKLWGDVHKVNNAKNWGALASRPRILAVNFTNVDDIPYSQPVEINYAYDDHWRSPKRISPCVVASERTQNPPMAISDTSSIKRQLTNAEALRVMSYPDTVLGGPAAGMLSDAGLRSVIGSGFDYNHSWFILRELKPPGSSLKTAAVAAPVVWEEATQTQYEKFMLGMDGPTRRQYFRDKQEAENFKLLECWLKLKDPHIPRRKAKHYAIPHGLKNL